MLITKEDFIGFIDALKEQYDYDKSYSVLLEQALGASNVPNYNNSTVTNLLFSLMQKQFPPDSKGNCEIERYCYELEFGVVDGVRVITAEMLWEALIKDCDISHGEKKELNEHGEG